MDYKKADLKAMRRYIAEEAPIIIHFNAKSITGFVKDTFYRNLFETGTGGGSQSKEKRIMWE